MYTRQCFTCQIIQVILEMRLSRQSIALVLTTKNDEEEIHKTPKLTLRERETTESTILVINDCLSFL